MNLSNCRETLSRYIVLSPEVEIEVIKAMKEYANSVVDSCIENANTKHIIARHEYDIVDQDSILKVKKLIK